MLLFTCRSLCPSVTSKQENKQNFRTEFTCHVLVFTEPTWHSGSVSHNAYNQLAYIIYHPFTHLIFSCFSFFHFFSWILKQGSIMDATQASNSPCFCLTISSATFTDTSVNGYLNLIFQETDTWDIFVCLWLWTEVAFAIHKWIPVI